MKKEVLSLFNSPELVIVGFLLFFMTFIGVLFWTMRKSQKNHYEKMSLLPLEITTAKDGYNEKL